MFARLDTNQDGLLQKDEIISGFKDIYGEVDNSEVDDLMALTDLNNSGDIDYFEWLAATVESSLVTNSQKLKQAFQYFDRDRAGKISLLNIKETMGSGGFSQNLGLSDLVYRDILNEVEHLGEDFITFDEFKNMMFKLKHGDAEVRKPAQPNEIKIDKIDIMPKSSIKGKDVIN